MPGIVGIVSLGDHGTNVPRSVDSMVKFLCHDNSHLINTIVEPDFAVAAADLNKGDFISRIVRDDSHLLAFTGQVYDQEAGPHEVLGSAMEPLEQTARSKWIMWTQRVVRGCRLEPNRKAP